MLLTIIIIVLIVLVFSNSNKNKKSQRALNTPPPPPPPPAELSQTNILSERGDNGLTCAPIRESQIDIPSADIDDIIIYKEEGGVINAYYNQKALDINLYNRARISTNNFTFKSAYEKDKRTVVLEDLQNLKHIIYNYSLNNGGYISKDDFVLDLGLQSEEIEEHCTENLIALCETLLPYSLKIYSKYSGYISNKIEQDQSGEYIINDGDLLFTIKLASPPQKEVETVDFYYNLLPKHYLDNVLNLSDIRIKSCLQESYLPIKKGDDVLEVVAEEVIKLNNYRTTIKAPSTGIIVYSDDIEEIIWDKNKVEKGDALFKILSSEDSFRASSPCKIDVSKDDFTKSVVIDGFQSYKDDNHKNGFRMGAIELFLQNVEHKNYIVLNFDKRSIQLNKKCTLHLLLDDESVITLNAATNPTKVFESTYKANYFIPFESLTILEEKCIIKWKITNEEGLTIKDGNNNCLCLGLDLNDIRKRLSYEAFRILVEEFIKVVKENVPEEELLDSDSATENSNSTCYVYLMIDTTNNFHKIGISNNPRYREHTLQSDKPTIELLCAKEYPSRAIAEAIESALHKTYASKRIRGEWFNLEPSDIIEVKETLK